MGREYNKTDKWKAYQKEYYKKNKEKMKAYVKKWSKEHKDKIKEYNKTDKYKARRRERELKKQLEQLLINAGTVSRFERTFIPK